MLSPYVPAWLTLILSPFLAFLTPRLPERIKPAALFGICAACIAAVIVLTPLDWPLFIEQTIILFGIVAGGYTIAKPLGRGSSIPVKTIGLTAMFALLFIGGAAWAQEAVAPVTEPIRDTASVWVAWALGALGGVLARLIGRIR